MEGKLVNGSSFEQGDLVQVVFEPNQRGVGFHSFCVYVSDVSVEGEDIALTFSASVFVKSRRFCLFVSKDGRGELHSCASDGDVYFCTVTKIEEPDTAEFDIEEVNI